MSDRTPMKPAGLPGARAHRVTGPPPRLQAVTEPVADKPSSPDDDTNAATATKPQPATRRTSETADVMADFSLSIPVALARGFRDTARSTGRTQANLLLDAIESTADQLPALLEAGGVEVTQGRIFTRTATTRSSKEDRTILTLRLRRSQLDQLDQLGADLGAASRSHLCTVALREYLTKDHR